MPLGILIEEVQQTPTFFLSFPELIAKLIKFALLLHNMQFHTFFALFLDARIRC